MDASNFLGVHWGSGAHVFTPPLAFTEYVTTNLSGGMYFGDIILYVMSF